jgi:LPXTG-site transpeptidase (sortase) family protein
MPKKTSKQRQSKRKQKRPVETRVFWWVGVVLLLVGVGMVLGVGVRRFFYYRSLMVNAKIAAVEQRAGVEPVWMGVLGKFSSRVEPAFMINNGWTVAEETASFLVGSGQVGEKGNLIIYGHNKEHILGKLILVKLGDKVMMRGSDGLTYHYRVTSAMEVWPSQTEWLEKSEEKIVTIYTCSGFMDSKRFVVRGELIEL